MLSSIAHSLFIVICNVSSLKKCYVMCCCIGKCFILLQKNVHSVALFEIIPYLCAVVFCVFGG